MMFWLIGFVPIMAQTSSSVRKINEFVIEESRLPPTSFVKHCNTPALGVIVFTTNIQGISFKIQNEPSMLVSINRDLQNNQYILCLKPFIEEGRKFQINITCDNYEGIFLTVSVKAAEVKSFKINSKEDPQLQELQKLIIDFQDKQKQPGYKNSLQYERDFEVIKKLIEIQSTVDVPFNNEIEKKPITVLNSNKNITRGTIVDESGTISGKVVDSSGDALIGVLIVVKGTSIGTVSNLDGNFSLTIPTPGQKTLEFRYIGYLTTERIVYPGNNIYVTLIEDAMPLRQRWFDWKTVRVGFMPFSILNEESYILDIEQSGFQVGWIGLGPVRLIPYTSMSITPMYELRNIKINDPKNLLRMGYLQIPIDINMHILRIGRSTCFPISVGPYMNAKLHGDKTINLDGLEWDVNTYNFGINFKAGVEGYGVNVSMCYAWGLTKEYSLPGENRSLKWNNFYITASYRF